MVTIGVCAHTYVHACVCIMRIMSHLQHFMGTSFLSIQAQFSKYSLNYMDKFYSYPYVPFVLRTVKICYFTLNKEMLILTVLKTKRNVRILMKFLHVFFYSRIDTRLSVTLIFNNSTFYLE